ncbi:hypothetical protein AAFH68_15270 [Flavobacterium sp. CGRL1]
MNVKIKSVKWIVLLNLLFVMAGCTSNKALIKTGEKKETQNWTGTWATAQMLVEPKKYAS